jgi:3-deoxy-D-manno-octulosonic-acid transferase
VARLIFLFYRQVVNILIWPAALLMSRHANFRGTILQRLGFRLPQSPTNRRVIWVHAASVGEVKAVGALVKELKRSEKDLFVCISAMTVTGRNVAGNIPEVDLVIPFPFDLAWTMKRYLLRLFPLTLFIVETEVWPNLIMMADKLGIPVVYVNARMTEKSYRRYMKFNSFIKEVLKNVHVLAITEGDGRRFAALGAPHVEILGNLKLDSVRNVDMSRSIALEKELGLEKRPVFIAGSIREGEESDILDAVTYAASQVQNLFSIVAPRHPQMLSTLIDLCKGKKFKWGLKSKMPKDTDILFVDTMGELFDLYGIADVAFVGGSLKDFGGQNILEPVAWGIPTIHGPYMANFTWALDVVKGYTVVVKNTRELGRAIVDMVKDREKSEELGRNAMDALRKKQGITQRYRGEISLYLGQRP